LSAIPGTELAMPMKAPLMGRARNRRSGESMTQRQQQPKLRILADHLASELPLPCARCM
jgi:hypothetical protein